VPKIGALTTRILYPGRVNDFETPEFRI